MAGQSRSARAGAGSGRTKSRPTDPLDGGYISIENENERDATYRIREVRRDGDRTLIDVGNVDFVRGMVDDLDYSKGYLYDFDVGQRFRVVRTYEAQW